MVKFPGGKISGGEISGGEISGDEISSGQYGSTDSSLERYNVEPSTPGLQLDIGYLEKGLQKQINALRGVYNEAFATGKYDIGLFKRVFLCD